ncbi:unnamed protein product [Hymenolepis diminuta]|uniref:Uncharacterized protein n=1 Tax=Hymenolepis diminuta TaxID=6216 RepID=A0A564Z9Z9_HYMDI|nr:unnamed protein product [Hymenolepis diminuta]
MTDLFVEGIDIPLEWRQEMRNYFFLSSDKLVFIGGWESGCNHLTSRVDSMDPLVGRVSPLTDLINARQRLACVATKNEMFVFTDSWLNAPAVYCREVYESASGRRVLC